MKQSLALLIVVLLGLATIACGSSAVTNTTSSSDRTTDHAGSTNAARGGYSKKDGDNDFDDVPGYHGSPENDDRELLATYGHRATPADTHAVTTLIKRYYTASAAGEGAAACSMLYSSLAAGLASGSSQPVQGAGKTCAGAMSLLLKHQHEQLAAEHVATMRVSAVYLKGDTGLAVLSFKTAPESEIILAREGKEWKIDALFDGIMP